MSKIKSDKTVDRRGFLRGIGTGAVGAATVVIATSSSPAVAIESATDKKKVRYRESEHVKKYYETNRY